MEFKDIVSVSKMSGLYKVNNVRPDGMIVTSLVNDETRFVSSRIHQFSMLENISIYTYEDAEPLQDVFRIVEEKEDEFPLPDAKKSSNDDIRAWFNNILKDHDEDQVYASDIKKLIKWYAILKPLNVFVRKEEENDNATEDVIPN